MKLLLLLLPFAAPATDDTDPAPAEDAGCAPERGLGPLADALDAAGAAAKSKDIEAFQPAYSEIRTRVDCLQEVLTPELAAAVHAAEYLHVAIEGDPQAKASALNGVFGVPGGRPPEWLSLPEGAEAESDTPFVQVEAPPQTALFVDGVPARSRPLRRGAIYQAVGPGGEVQWSRWLEGEESLPDTFLIVEGEVEASGPELLETITGLLADGEYQRVIDLAIPAASAHPELRDGFLAAADLAADQIRRSQFDPATVGGFDPYAPRPRRGALRRGDERKDFLLGFDVGLPSSIHGEWKLGRSAVDGIGIKVGAGGILYSGSSVVSGVDGSLYLDWNLTDKWQLQTTVLGIFVDPYGSPLVNFGAAIQYDPPTPIELTVGVRAGPYNVAPTATVGFLW